MSKTNCINCGAAKDTDEIKCPFCGTTYLDFTAIDFSSNDPVVCKFVLPNTVKMANSDARVIMSMLAKPRLEEITETVETTDVYGGWCNHPLASFRTSCDMNIGVSFKPVMKNDGSIFTLTAKQE